MKNSMKRKAAALMTAVTILSMGTAAALADYGDADKDKGDEPRYKVGQEVEVYQTPLHVTTRRSKIIAVKKQEDGHWTYTLDKVLLNAKKGSHDPCDAAIPDLNKKKKVSADYIESN